MVGAGHPIELEGTWEEILRRGSELAGLRVRVTVLTAHAAASSVTDQPHLDRILAPLIERAQNIQKDPAPGKLPGDSEEFLQAITEQLREQGIKL